MKEFVAGVYKIKNIVNEKVWIGSSWTIIDRLSNHWKAFNSNKNSLYLQRAFNKYGYNSFEWSVIEEVAVFFDKPTKNDKKLLKENLLFWEQIYMDNYESYNPEKGYNICSVAGNCLGVKKSEETKIKSKITNSLPEVKKRRSNAAKEVAARPEIKEAKSKCHKGKTLSKEIRKKVSIGGKIAQNKPERKRQLHEQMVGKNNNMYGRNDQCYVPGGIVDISRNKKGKTNIEIYGEERAKRISEQHSKVAKIAQNKPERKRQLSEQTSGQNNPNSTTNRIKRFEKTVLLYAKYFDFEFLYS
jgi:group I intron endonuclease